MSKPPADAFPLATEMSCIWDDLGRAMEQLERHGVGEYFDPHRKAERFRAAVQDVTTGLSRLEALIKRLGDLALHTPGMIEDMRVDRVALNELLRNHSNEAH